MATEFGISLDDAVNELQHHVEEAINFMWSEFEDDWATAERYYAGGCDLPSEEGRSDAVKTEVRDIIRAVMPSIMRIMYQARTPVEYIPTHIDHAAFIDQQSLYVNQLFKASGGYKILYNAVLQALKLKIGPIKVWHESDPLPDYIKLTCLTEIEVEELKELPDFEVITVDPNPNIGEQGYYDVEGYKYHNFGKLYIEDFPVYEFFVSRNATSLEDARVHGHHREITVAEALEMGLEYEDWSELTGSDPENKHAAESAKARRGYAPDADDDDSEDPTQMKILLTEVYCKYDLDGDGKEARYCFYLGGSTYKYITHHEIEDYCIDVVCADPQPYTVVGRSLADILIEKQDNETSIYRAMIDNAHIANNPRMAGDPNSVDFQDLMNNAIGAPLKTRGTPNIQVVDIPFTAGNLLPFLQYMEQDTETQVGVTKAATGLDPDALQSTDKEAVRNTIQLSQGQIELMARNIVETGLTGAFRKLLKLAQRHMDRAQIVRTKGMLIPVDVAVFDPTLMAEPAVGIGAANPDQKAATLQFVLQKQEQILSTMGMDNPFTSLTQMYHTLEDIVELGGLRDPGRYFSVVTPQMEEAIARGAAEDAANEQQAAQQSQPIDPGMAMVTAERTKAQATLLGKQLEAQVDREKLALDKEVKQKELDLQRDKTVQDRIIELRKIRQQAQEAATQAATDRAQMQIQQEQAENNEQSELSSTPNQGAG